MVTDVFTRFVPSLDALIEFQKANLEAFVQAQSAMVKGVQEITREIAAQAQSHIETAVSASQSAFSARTFKDVAEINADTAKGSYDKLIAGTNKLSELGMQVANDAFAPIKARASAATETFLKPIAA